MGAQLSETRWITATLASTVLRHELGDGMLGRPWVDIPGGAAPELRGLCGVTATKDHAMTLAAAAALWDETSGYGAVEATPATNALPAAPAVITIQVSSDVRWAPVPVIASAPAVDATRATAAVSEALAYGSLR